MPGADKIKPLLFGWLLEVEVPVVGLQVEGLEVKATQVGCSFIS